MKDCMKRGEILWYVVIPFWLSITLAILSSFLGDWHLKTRVNALEQTVLPAETDAQGGDGGHDKG